MDLSAVVSGRRECTSRPAPHPTRSIQKAALRGGHNYLPHWRGTPAKEVGKRITRRPALHDGIDTRHSVKAIAVSHYMPSRS